MSFCSRTKKERYIPQTRFYDGQKLGIIERDDKVYQVSPIWDGLEVCTSNI